MRGELTIEQLVAYIDDSLSVSERVELEEAILHGSNKAMWYDFLAEQYIAGGLSENWQAAAEKLIDTDPEFASLVRFQGDIVSNIQASGRTALRSEVMTALPKVSSGPTLRRQITLWASAAAAVLLVAIVATNLLRTDCLR